MDPNAGMLDRLQQNLVATLLRRLDRLPRHVGIIMDGNRRFAHHHGADRKAGHASGFDAMSRVLAMAYSAGISEVSVYAFSIENFNRSPEEVDDLMEIARTRLTELISHAGLAQEYNVRIRVVGDLALLPADIRALADQITRQTKQNNNATLNLCMPYTSREDMRHALALAALDAKNHVDTDPLSVAGISARLRTAGGRPLDLLIRTSNTQRLSDFLLWEITDHTYIDFVPALWPEYTRWQFLQSVLRWWQRSPR